MEKHINTHYSSEAVLWTQTWQDRNRRELLHTALNQGLAGNVYTNDIYPLRDWQVPVLYLAGGMVNSSKINMSGSRMRKGFWHSDIIRKTGGKIIGDDTQYGIMPDAVYGNFVAENPMENGSCTNRVYIDADYIRLLLSHGSVNYVEAGFGNEGNPGHAQLAEIAFQYLKGGLNITLNEKGSMNKSQKGLFEENTLPYEQLITDESCLVTSMGQAADLICDDNGKTLRKLIADANNIHNKYWADRKDAIENRRNSPKIFIGGSSDEKWAIDVAQRLESKGLEFVFGRDEIDYNEDFGNYLRSIGEYDFAVTFQGAGQNKFYNRLIPLGESASTVIHRVPTIHLSEPYERVEEVLNNHPEFANRAFSVEHSNRRNFDKNRERRDASFFNTHRLLGSDFISRAPFTRVYGPKYEVSRAIDDLVLMTDNFVRRF